MPFLFDDLQAGLPYRHERRFGTGLGRLRTASRVAFIHGVLYSGFLRLIGAIPVDYSLSNFRKATS